MFYYIFGPSVTSGGDTIGALGFAAVCAENDDELLHGADLPVAVTHGFTPPPAKSVQLRPRERVRCP